MTACGLARRSRWRLVAATLVVCLGVTLDASGARDAAGASASRRAHLLQLQPSQVSQRSQRSHLSPQQDEPSRTFDALEANVLARTRAGQGADDETRQLADRARQLAERTWPAHDPRVRRAIGLIALVAFSTGSYDESVRLYRRALAPPASALAPREGAPVGAKRGVPGRDGATREASRFDAGARDVTALDDESRARLLDGYGQALGQAGQHRDAVRLLGEALDLRVRARGPNHRDVATVLEHLAAVQLVQGERTQGRMNVERALAIRESHSPATTTEPSGLDDVEEDPFLSVSLNLMGDVLWFEGQFAQAERWYARAVCVSQRALGPLHPLVALQTRNYANVMRRTAGDAERVGALLQWSLRIAERALGPAHPEVAGTLNDLAVVARSQGDYRTARQSYERAMRAIDTRLGADHLWAAAVRHNLAVLCQRLGDLSEAIRLEQQAAAIWTRRLGATHADVGRAASALGGMYADAGLHARARRSYLRAIAIREQRDGPLHENVAVSRGALADLLIAMGRLDEAWTQNARALAIWEAADATTDPWFLSALATRGRLQAARGDLAAARATLASVVATQARVFGPDNPDLGRLRITYGELLATLGAPGGALADRVRKDGSSKAAALNAPAPKDRVSKDRAPKDEALKDAALKDAVPHDAALTDETLTDEALAQAVQAESVGRAHLQLTMRDLSERVALGYAAARPKGLDLAASIVTRADAASASPARVRTVFDALVRSRGVVLDEMAARHRGEMAAGSAAGVATGTTTGATTGAKTGVATGGATETAPGTDTGTATVAVVGAATGLADGAIDRATDAATARTAAADGAELAPRAATLSRARQRLANLIVRGPEKLSAERYQRLVDEARVAKEAAERALAEVSDDFRASLRRGKLTLEDVRAALPADAVLVSFLRFERLDAVAPSAARTLRPAAGDPQAAGGAVVSASGRDNRRPDGAFAGSARTARETGSALASGRRRRSAYAAFLLRAGSPDVVVVPLGDAAAIEVDVRRWRAEIRTGLLRTDRTLAASERAALSAGRALRRRVWDPLTPHLENASRLFIVPDGALHLVSFAALPLDSLSPAFLVETGPTLHYLATERDLVPPDAPAPVGRGLLALGAPAFGARSNDGTMSVLKTGSASPIVANAGATNAGAANTGAGNTGAANMSAARTRAASDAPCQTLQSMRFEALPGSLREIEEVARIWSGASSGDTAAAADRADRESVDLLSRAAASERAFKRDAPGRRVLHLATHGFFLDAPCAPDTASERPSASSISQALPTTPPSVMESTSAAVPSAAVSSAAVATSAAAPSAGATSDASQSGGRARNVGATRAVGGLSTKPSKKSSTKASASTSRAARVTSVTRIENPLMSSGLAFAGVNRRARLKADEEDGLLTAEEVAGLDLRGVEWAVLSACDTGVGAITNGEGVFGLRRAFQIAGVRTVILSLWAVEDRAAIDWMRVLYERRRTGADTTTAVRAASLALLRQRRARGESTHPFFWAGFVASGDWR